MTTLSIILRTGIVMLVAASVSPVSAFTGIPRSEDIPVQTLPDMLATPVGNLKKLDLGQWDIPKVREGGDLGALVREMNAGGGRDFINLNDNINDYNWVAMEGRAMFHEDFGAAIFNLPVNEYPTPILSATNSPETYALGPFNSSYPYYNDIRDSGYLAGQGGYLWLHANVHDYVTFPIFDTGWLWTGGEHIYLVSVAWVMEFNGHDEQLVKAAGLGGVNEGGHIYFPCLQSVCYTIDGENFYYCDDDGRFGFALPGVTVSDEDNRIELSMPAYCFDNNIVTIHMKAGRNIKLFKYDFFSEFSEDMYQAVVQSGSVGEYVAEGDITVNLEGNVSGNKCVYFAVVAGTAEGVIKDSGFLELYLVPNDHEDWEAKGTADYTDGIVAGIYDIENHTYTLDYQEHRDTPGYIRIVDPYQWETGWMYADPEFDVGHSHRHYLFIDMTDPSAVVLETSPLGLSVDPDSGHAKATSHAFESMKMEGKSKAEVKAQGLTGSYNDVTRTLTFPARSIWYAESGYNNGQYYETNKAGAFRIKLNPGSSGLEEGMETDSSSPQTTPRYYNLQGQPIPVPTPGIPCILLREGKEAMIITRK